MNQNPTYFDKKIFHRIKLVLICLLIIVIIGMVFRIVAYIKLRYATEQQAVLNVAIIKAEQSKKNIEIVLPGNVQAWHEATLYARTSGYVSKWMVDIGSQVKTGDLLAEIASPEVDAQLRQAEADLKTAEANDYLAQTTAARWTNLLKTDSVSKQETDEKVSNAQATAAVVKSTKANRDRLRELVSYQHIIAPFNGVIMSRTTDVGRLINSGNGTVALFRLVQSNLLRVYIRVPEYYSSNILPGITAQLYFPQHPEKTYTATLLDTAKAIDMTSRTLLVQFQLNNPNNELLAGSYAEVRLSLPASMSVILPVNALIFRAEGLQVATIDGDSKALLKSIVIGRDFGDTVEVVTGIRPNESIILNPPDSLLSGEKVHIIQPNTVEKDKQ
jgi:RND family efflux transporter MFP subunit